MRWISAQRLFALRPWTGIYQGIHSLKRCPAGASPPQGQNPGGKPGRGTRNNVKSGVKTLIPGTASRERQFPRLVSVSSRESLVEMGYFHRFVRAHRTMIRPIPGTGTAQGREGPPECPTSGPDLGPIISCGRMGSRNRPCSPENADKEPRRNKVGCKQQAGPHQIRTAGSSPMVGNGVGSAQSQGILVDVKLRRRHPRRHIPLVLFQLRCGPPREILARTAEKGMGWHRRVYVWTNLAAPVS